MIEKIDLPETGLIIGDNFPTKNEDAYMREAAKHKLIAGEVVPGIQAAVQRSIDYTTSQFRGQAGSGLTDNLNVRQEAHAEDLQLHHNLGQWYELGAQNIIATKTAMNEACSDYHTKYAEAQQRAFDDAWPQTRLAQTKTELVTKAQNEIHTLHTTYGQRHTEISAGIVAGCAPAGGHVGVTDGGGTDAMGHESAGQGPGPGGIGPSGVGRIDDFQGASSSPSRGIQGPYDTDVSGGPAQVRPQFPGLHEGTVPGPSVRPDTPTSAGGGVQGPFDVPGYEPAQVRPAGHTEPIDPSAGDYERLYPKLFPNPLPGQPGGGTWTDVAPSSGDANHPPHGGLIPNFPGEHSPRAAEPPAYTQVQPNGQGGYDVVAPGTDPANGNRTDGSR